ncbi:DUF2513 domain-containing protein [Alkalicoccobacillus gibsonii]|uniref:DUF2513 domain-containing protein n=1 Tax=Alkalicoccobacillus gibsonii TaxID=79881 RepID=A0ABU9VHG1_9BACI
MKRELDLIRDILILLEEDESRDPKTITSEDYSEEVVHYNLRLLYKEGFIEAHSLEGGTRFLPRSLTWDGHNLLADIKDDSVWSKVKENLKRHSGTASIEVIKAIAATVAKKAIINE